MSIPSASEAVYEYLNALHIPYRTLHHAAARTMADCECVSEALNAMECKNFFLTTKSHKVFCIALTRPDVRFQTSDVSKQAGTPRLTFADAADMNHFLHTYPGAVSPMGLIFDDENRVRLLIDDGLRKCESLAFHPCDNTQSLAMKTSDFLNVFLPSLHKTPEWITIHNSEA